MKKKKTKRKLLLRAASLVLAALILCPMQGIYAEQLRACRQEIF